MPRLRMENKMKKSIYLLDYESKDGKYYLMSTYSGNIISIDSAKKKKLQKQKQLRRAIRKKKNK